MATFAKTILSGSTGGRPILIANVATPGTLIHTGSTNTSVLHEVWLYAMNSDTTARKITVEWGGTTAPNDIIELTVPAESGLVLVAPGLLLQGASPTALTIRAFAASGGGNVVNVTGFVNSIS